MGESQGVKGDLWTRDAVYLLEALGWKQLGSIRYDAPCTMHGKKNATHGLDAVFSCYNPYLSIHQGVFVETKNYAWGNFHGSDVQDWVENLTEIIECVPHSKEFCELFNRDGISFETGLLLIWANNGKYNHDTYLGFLEGLKIPRKNSNFRIFVASNYDILRFWSLIRSIQSIKNSYQGASVHIWYPSIDGSMLQKSSCLSLEALYSSYVFVRAEIPVPMPGGGIRVDKHTIVYDFESISADSLALLYSAIKALQLEDCSKMRIIIQERTDAVRIIADEFVREAKQAVNGAYEVCIEYLDLLADIPHVPASE